MASSIVKEMIEAGIHFGHRTAGWNPKMKPYIFGKRNGIHIIDVRQTIKGILLGKKFITRTVASGKDILFVGTKRQARPTILAVCEEHDQPYVTERWLGGTLTNFRTIRERLSRLIELEQLMESEEWQQYSKKMASMLTRERKKITRNLGGIRNMNKLPGAVVVIDVQREQNALREATILGIPTICLIDTDSNPDLADIPVPGNDDAMRSIELVLQQFGQAVKAGKSAITQQREGIDKPSDGSTPQRRSRRAQFSADGSVSNDAATRFTDATLDTPAPEVQSTPEPEVTPATPAPEPTPETSTPEAQAPADAQPENNISTETTDT